MIVFLSVRSFRRVVLCTLLAGCGLLLPVGAGAAPLVRPLPAQQQPGLGAGALAERNGDYAAAEAAYRAGVASSTPAIAAAAQFALGRLLERRGRSADALAPLQAVVDAWDGTPDGLRATFLLGEAQADQQQNQAAAASFQTYLAGGGAAAGYAAVERALALQADKDDAGALLALAGPLQATSVTVRRAALQAAGRAHERLGDPAQAAADQQAFADTRPPASDRANALLEAGRLDELAGDGAAAAAVLQAVVQQYPGFAAAGAALERLDALGSGVDPLQRGLVLYSLRRNDEARAVFERLLSADPTGAQAAPATYYLARIADRQDRNDEALAGYAQAYTLDPAGPLAADAVWSQAQLLQYLERYGEAGGVYASLAQQFPQSEHTAEAAFTAGLMAYLDGRPGDATATWRDVARTARGGDGARAQLWLGKLALTRGDATGAAAAFAEAQTLQPTGYYGLRAEALASGAGVSLAGAAVSPPANDWPAVERWLAAWAGPEDAAGFVAVQATQDWTEALELDLLGWRKTPDQMLNSALAGIAQQPWALYRAARALTERGRTTLALTAAGDLLRLAGVQFGGPLSAPAALLRLAYPLDYADLINQNAARTDLDPLLIAATMRQESAFDPAAGSSAGAQGLLQLVPGTAHDMAAALGLTDFTTADLLRPLINIQLGAAFLARQAQASGRDLNRTLAAYNAGGGNANRWARQAGSDPDRFYETVDFSETRLYLRLVTANYAIYNALYRGAPRPTLLPTAPPPPAR